MRPSRAGVAGGQARGAGATPSSASRPGTGRVSGIVRASSGAGLAGATVVVEGQSTRAVTSADGTFELKGVGPGSVFLTVRAPAGFLDGGNRASIAVRSDGATTGISIMLSGRPSKSADYLGEASCTGCHAPAGEESHESAHYRFVTRGTSRLVRRDMWPAVGRTLNLNIKAVDPVDGTTMVPVYLCQNRPGAYAMKFAGAPDCLVSDGTLVPVAATIGGEGDGGVDGRPNFGVYKQRYLARPSDIPYARDRWAVPYLTEADRDRDLLILPVFMVQDGNTDPSLGPVSPKFYPVYTDRWLTQPRTISRLCSSCHATGAALTFSGTNWLVTSFSYRDLNITCEKCHGPGSEHVSPPPGVDGRDRIIRPQLLSAAAAQQACGICHAEHEGSSKVPQGLFKMPFNASHLSDPGGGAFVPGLYDAAAFINGYGLPVLDGGAINTWPDRVHALSHSQQLPMLLASKHHNNSERHLACFDCHDAHSGYFGPAAFRMADGRDEWVLKNPRWKDNTLCLGCHAGRGSFAGVSLTDVAALHSTSDALTKNGTAATFAVSRVAESRLTIARSVGRHMQATAGMGVAAYDPLNDARPVGRCASCHMPKTGKKNDLDDLSQWHLGRDANGETALVEGNVASHTFDVIWPAQSGALRKASGGKELDIMPNSCGKCHPGARLSGK
jgi:hypothetical protein